MFFDQIFKSSKKKNLGAVLYLACRAKFWHKTIRPIIAVLQHPLNHLSKYEWNDGEVNNTTLTDKIAVHDINNE